MAKSNKTDLEAPKIKELIDKLTEIQEGFKRNLADLHQKIETIESEPELSINLDNFKRDAELRVDDLEEEVKQLREQLSAIKELLS
jgi:archaellum component FlaC